MGSLKMADAVHGVQGLAPARGRRRNACAGKRWRMLKGSLKRVGSLKRMSIFGDEPSPLHFDFQAAFCIWVCIHKAA